MRRLYALLSLQIFLPVVAFAQEVSTTANTSMADTLRYLALAMLLPILAAAGKFAAQAIETWASKNGQLAIAANAKITGLIADAVAYVDAETKAARIKVMEDGKVTKEEAAMLQALALTTAKRFLGENGLKLITAQFGVVGTALEDWLKGRIQGVFEAKANAAVAAEAGGTPTVPS